MNVSKQGPWSLWWTVYLTCGIYSLFWYDRINKELSSFLNEEVRDAGKWWSQLIPIYNLYARAQTAKLLNSALESVGSSVRVSPIMAGLWASLWFGSYTRYLQRRINLLSDINSATSSVPSLAL